MLKKKLLPLSLIVLLTILLLVLINKQETPPTPVEEPTQLAQDEWHLYNSTSWRLNRNDPNQQQILTSPFIREQANITYITQPNFQQTELEKHTRLTSQHAEIQENKVHEFFGEVKVLTLPNQENIQSEYLQYNKNTELITSDQYVEIWRDEQRTSGTGLTLDPKNDKLQLHSKVKTYYEPNN